MCRPSPGSDGFPYRWASRCREIRLGARARTFLYTITAKRTRPISTRISLLLRLNRLSMVRLFQAPPCHRPTFDSIAFLEGRPRRPARRAMSHPFRRGKMFRGFASLLGLFFVTAGVFAVASLTKTTAAPPLAPPRAPGASVGPRYLAMEAPTFHARPSIN